MNTGMRYTFGRAKYPNVYIGGISSFATNESILADEISETYTINVRQSTKLTSQDIKLFEIDSFNNLKFNVTEHFGRNTDNQIRVDITFLYDWDGFKFTDNVNSFIGLYCPIKRYISTSIFKITNQGFRLTPIQYVIAPNADFDNEVWNSTSQIKRVYMPGWPGRNDLDNAIGSAAGNAGAIWYFDIALQTSDGGNPDPSINFSLLGTANEVRFIQNYDKPNPVTDLNVSNITTNSAQLNFTSPLVNTNANDFYYVYLDWNNISFEFKYSERHEISAFYDEITGNGDTITGLPNNTKISVQVQTVDFYHNVSTYSNKVTFTTL